MSQTSSDVPTLSTKDPVSSDLPGAGTVSLAPGHVGRISDEAPTELPTLPDHEVMEVLGRGGMGVVYKARQLKLNRLVALKMILAGAHAGPKELARFRSEAGAVARLQHPNIVQIYEIGEHGGLPFFSLEYVDGTNLAKELDGTPWPGVRAANLIEILARTIHVAHQSGIIHRDLKPGNVLLTTDGIPKITDFGLAKQLDSGAPQTESGAILGTPSYMAPEQAGRSGKSVSPATDVYALGAILYELLTGRPPFRAETALDTVLQVVAEEPVPPRQLLPKIPRDLETICLKCLRKETGKRYPSALELAEDLNCFSQQKPIRARPVGYLERAWRWGRRNRWVAILLLTLAGVVVFAIAGLTGLWMLAEQRRAEVQFEKEQSDLDRQQAEHNFQQARRAVDEFFTKVSENQLIRQPGLQGLRRELLEAALRYYLDFLTERKDDASLRSELAETYFRVGLIRSELGAKEEALTAFQEASRIREEQLGDNSTDGRLMSALANTYENIGRMHLESSRPAEGIPFHERSLRVREALIQAFPDNLDYRSGLGASLNDYAVVLLESGRPQDAVAALQRAVVEQSTAVEKSPATLHYRKFLGNHYANMARSQWRLGKTSEALRSFEQARTLYGQVLHEDPGDAGLVSDLAFAVVELGQLYQGLDRPAEAIEAFKQARNMLEQLASQNPNVPQYQLDLAFTFESLADLQKKVAPTEVDASYRKSLEIAERLVRNHPNDLKYRNYLGRVLNNFGLHLEATSRRDDAVASYQKAIQHQRVAFDRQPQVPRFRIFLSNHYANLARLQREFGRPGEAVSASLERQKLWPRDGGELFRIAGELALCIPLVVKGKTLPTADDKAQQNRYAELAITALRQAILNGYRDLQAIKSSPNLAALRSVPEYKALLVQLESGKLPAK